MAPNKLAAALTRSSRRIVSVLVYSFLEWILITFILSNSFFSYMIRKFAVYFGLKQPCILCSRVDHLLEPMKITDSYKSLVCEIHATEISNMGYCLNHQRFTESQETCEECSLAKTKNILSDDSAAERNEKISRCSCCEKIMSKKNHCGSECEPQIISDIGSFYLREAAEDDSNEDDEPFGNADSGGTNLENTRNKDSTLSIEETDHLLLSADQNKCKVQECLQDCLQNDILENNNDISSVIKQLKSDLEAEKKARNELYAELEADRNAAAIATNQTMAMITRLQEEKASMQMEALQYQRMMEEQAEYDHDALHLLNEVVTKKEKEIQELENELDVYRQRVSDYEAKEKTVLLSQKSSGNLSSSTCSIDNDSDVLSIDLNCHYNKVEDNNLSQEISLIDCSKQWGAIEDSLEELEEERMSIIKRLKELEQKLQNTENQEEELFEGGINMVEPLLEDNDKKDLDPNSVFCSQEVNLVRKLQNSENQEEEFFEGEINMVEPFLEENDKKFLDPNSVFCSQEVNLVSPCFSTSIVTSEHNPKSMASVARKLLDLVESDDNEIEDMTLSDRAVVETDSRRLAIEKEMEHVYGRLQALEADTEFLRHCIGSVNKGQEGLKLLQEILQHLRELRDSDICL